MGSALGFLGLGFRVQGFRVSGLGLRGFRGLGLRASSFGVGVLGLGVSGLRVQGFRVSGLGFVVGDNLGDSFLALKCSGFVWKVMGNDCDMGMFGCACSHVAVGFGRHAGRVLAALLFNCICNSFYYGCRRYLRCRVFLSVATFVGWRSYLEIRVLQPTGVAMVRCAA